MADERSATEHLVAGGDQCPLEVIRMWDMSDRERLLAYLGQFAVFFLCGILINWPAAAVISGIIWGIWFVLRARGGR